MNPRRCVLDAQWRRLVALGEGGRPRHVVPERYSYRETGKASFEYYGAADYDAGIRVLGKWLHRPLRKASCSRFRLVAYRFWSSQVVSLASNAESRPIDVLMRPPQ